MGRVLREFVFTYYDSGSNYTGYPGMRSKQYPCSSRDAYTQASLKSFKNILSAFKTGGNSHRLKIVSGINIRISGISSDGTMLSVLLVITVTTSVHELSSLNK